MFFCKEIFQTVKTKKIFTQQSNLGACISDYKLDTKFIDQKCWKMNKTGKCFERITCRCLVFIYVLTDWTCFISCVYGVVLCSDDEIQAGHHNQRSSCQNSTPAALFEVNVIFLIEHFQDSHYQISKKTLVSTFSEGGHCATGHIKQ